METVQPKPIGFSSDKAQQVLDKHNIDVLIAATPVNVFYTTGMPTLHVAPNPILYVLANQFPTLSLVRRDGKEYAVTWMVYQSTKKWTWVDEVTGTVSPQQTMEAVCNKIAEWGLSDKTIGLESLMPRYQYDFIRQRFPQAIIVDADRAFLDMRLTKTAEEIDRIKKSTRIAEKAIQSVIDAAKEGITDNELLQIARRTIIDEGAEGWDHLTMGLGASDPEAPGLGYTVKRGEINRIDIGVVSKGYISDISREFVVGDLPEGAQEHMDNLIKVQEFLEQNIKPGVNTVQLYKEAKNFGKSLVKRGMVFVTVHSLGLECEEVHLFSPMRSLDIAFEEGMVLDFEVWQSYRNFNLVGIEDCYVIRASGVERISSLDKQIFVR
jgi:Xaa-Pro aminopeptidase